jgi:hypothetical protein
MKTVNSLSGGKTSSYIAKHYPADHNIFALVRTDDVNCMFPDKKLRQIVSDKIGKEFIGTLEMDDIIYTMLDLEQFIGQEITWVSGQSFDEIIIRRSGENGHLRKYLPNVVLRFCTQEMKVRPINDWWFENVKETVEMRIGFRANEMNRAKSMIEKCDENQILWDKAIIGKTKTGNKNKWKSFPMRKPVFPLIDDSIFKDKIEEYWKDKPVRFAYKNNCVGCFHRNEMLLKHMSEKEPNKFDWFVEQEKTSRSNRGWRMGITYEKIKKFKSQFDLFDDDFNDCDSGYCGL